MPTREILMSHPVSTLRAEIAKANLSQKADKNLFKRAVSKMRKDELIAVMMAPAYKDRFHHIKMREKKVARRPLKKPRYPAVDKAREAKAKAEEKQANEEARAKKRRARRPATPVLDVPETAPKKRKPKKKPRISDAAVARAAEKAKAERAKKGKPKKKPRISDAAVARAAEKAKGSKRPDIKLVSFDPKLTVTKADGSVKEVKKRVRTKK
jgi:hypothetical protein